MEDRRPAIEAFFRDYAERSSAALKDPPQEEPDAIAAAFAAYVVAASPTGVQGGSNDQDFRALIPQGFARYREIGGKAMRVTRVKITELDDCNAIARVDWQFTYERPTDNRRGDIVFQNIYLLNFADGTPRIFAYVTPDEEQTLRNHGLI